MSAKFINLHLLWASRGGEEGKEEGSNTRAGFVSAEPEMREWNGTEKKKYSRGIY